MSTLRISDAPLLPDVDGTEKIPTGGRGDYAISIDQIKGHIFQDIGKELVGLGNVDNTSDLDKPVSTAQQVALNLKADKTYVDVNLDLKADKTNVYTRTETSLALSQKADLVNGVVPENQIPSSFNDVLEFTTPSLPIIGESGKIYVTTDTNKTWRWATNKYVEISGWNPDSVSKRVTIPTYSNAAYGVDPATGVANGAYFNVRSSNDDSYIDEYQNVGGVPTLTGKSYPSSNALNNIPHNNLKDRDMAEAHPASAILDGNKNQHEINNEIVDVERHFKTDLSTTLNLIKSKMTRPYILRFGRSVSYTLTNPFILDDLIIGIDLNHCEITYTYEQPTGAGSSSQISAFTQHNRTKPFFSKNGKLKYTGTFNIGTSYAGQISGFDIRTQVGFKGLRYSNIEASGFNRAGIQTAASGAYIEQYIVEGCYLHHNRAAGEWRGFVDGAYLTKNTCTFNGLDSDIGTGYGLAGIGECYPKNQFIWANDCSNNYRKGIDFHSGANVFVWSNKCHNNKFNGIYVGVDNRLDGVVQPVGTVLIEGNDLLLSDYSGAADNWGLYVGKSFNTETSGVASIKIKNNTIKRPTANLGNALNLIALDLGGFYRPVVDVTGNTIDAVNCGHAVYVYNSVAASNTKGVLNVKNNNFNIGKPDSAFFIFALNTNIDIFNFCENNVAVENHAFALMTNFSVRKGATPAAWVSGSYINNNMYLPDFNFGDGDLFPNDQRDYILSQGNFLNGKPHRDYKNGIYTATAKTIPTTLYWYRGSIITNSDTSALAASSWKCTVAGNAGTWIDTNATASTSDVNLKNTAHTINTVNKYTGRIVYNSTIGKMYFAISSAPTGAWRAFDGSGDITPI